MKIALLVPDLRGGGVERVRLLLAREFLANGHDVDIVLLRKDGVLLDQVPDQVRIVDLGAERFRQGFMPLVQYLREQQPGALIASMWPLTVFAPIAAKLARYKGRVIISEHSPLSIAYGRHGRIHRAVMRASQRMCYPLADVRVAVSSGIAGDLAALSCLPREQFTVIHNPAALGRANFDAVCPEQLSGRTGPIILTVGTLKPVKRHDVLIDAFSRLPDSLGATLCILGEGQMREKLEQQIDRLGLQGKVLLPGFAAAPGPWYAHSDLFVLSSDYEGFGNVIVEAMEYGVPVVSTDCPVGPTEILEGGRYGKLVSLGDVDALSSGMLASLRGEPDRESLKRRAKYFSLDVIARQYLDTIFR